MNKNQKSRYKRQIFKFPTEFSNGQLIPPKAAALIPELQTRWPVNKLLINRRISHMQTAALLKSKQKTKIATDRSGYHVGYGHGFGHGGHVRGIYRRPQNSPLRFTRFDMGLEICGDLLLAAAAIGGAAAFFFLYTV